MADVDSQPSTQPTEDAPKNQGKGKGKHQNNQGKKGGNKPVSIAQPTGPLELEPPPLYLDYRIKVFERIKEAKKKECLPESIKITLPDGKVVDGKSWETTPYAVASSISKGLAQNVVVAKVNDVMWDLYRPLEADCTLELFKFDSAEGKKVFWHSSAHVLGQALERKYGGKLCMGPALEEGFYYDVFLGENQIKSDDYESIQLLVNKIIKEKQNFERIELTKQEALEMFKFNQFKLEIIQNKVPDDAICTAYRCGPLIDLCKGPHLPSTDRVKAFALTKNSSAYFLGNSERESLQRVYGISFPDNKELKQWQTFQQQAAERDHRAVGLVQELFFFHPYSPGCPMILPHGARIYNRLMQLMKDEYRIRGFTEVITPNMYNTDLWKKSGHWQNYQENMYSFDCENQEFALKPMNCPAHCLIFGHRIRSYRELPIRLADFGVLHRNEISGALRGLTRVRRFQQDDAHIFCKAEDIESEMQGCIDFLQHIYGIFGFNFDLELSTRPEKYLGEIEVWNAAEKQLETVLNGTGLPWKLNPGDGAFYGPKVDIHIKDALNRSHQCATIQLDFQLPERFELEYTSEQGTARPVIIHRAILGSVERMMAILIEHTGGKWPFWLSPRQAAICPVSQKFNEYADKLKKTLSIDNQYFVDVKDTDVSIQKKVREAQLAQYNYILVVGEKEMQNGTVNVRTRDNQIHGEMSIENLLSEWKDNICSFKKDI